MHTPGAQHAALTVQPLAWCLVKLAPEATETDWTTAGGTQRKTAMMQIAGEPRQRLRVCACLRMHVSSPQSGICV